LSVTIKVHNLFTARAFNVKIKMFGMMSVFALRRVRVSVWQGKREIDFVVHKL
jgi:hypothetical protein